MKQYLNKTILFTLGGNDALNECDVIRISPNEKYVYIYSDHPHSIGGPGWVSIDNVKVVDSWDRYGKIDKSIISGPTKVVQVS